MTGAVDWIAVDWGTTRLRAWAIGRGGEVRAAASSDRGMGTLRRDEYERALNELVGDWLGAGRTEVVCCGMVGSRQGWVEAPYLDAPCAPFGGRLVTAPTVDPRLCVRIIPGVRQRAPADVMRGEETQIAGVLEARAGFDGVICLPGTHTKWVHVSAGEIVSFQTFMTGEMFAALSTHTVLRHSVADQGSDPAAFAEAVDEAMGHPERMAARLFGLRAEALLRGLDPVTARARLSGSLIGLELAGSRPYWLGRELLLVGAASLCELYGQALAVFGGRAEELDGTAMTLAGLGAAHRATAEV